MRAILIYLSAFIVTFIIYHLVNRALMNKYKRPAVRAVLTFIISGVITVLIVSLILGTVVAFINYVPILMFWMIIDIMRNRQKRI